ncbi:MAG: hypothetical protein M3305_15525 [Actinomycetota bacterium]|nr:hypothetical protein [Actinomycetota bacterium]
MAANLRVTNWLAFLISVTFLIVGCGMVAAAVVLPHRYDGFDAVLIAGGSVLAPAGFALLLWGLGLKIAARNAAREENKPGISRSGQGQPLAEEDLRGGELMVNVEHLRSLSEEELIRLHNEEMQHRAAHYNVYLDELRRREAVRQGERIEELTTSLNRLTWWVVVLTVLIAIATLVGVGLTAWTLLSGG